MEQGPDGGRVLSDPARLTLPHAVIEKCTVETRVHMTTQLQLCVCERGEGGGSEKEREGREREREREIHSGVWLTSRHSLVIKCSYYTAYTSIFFTHEKVFIELEIAGILPGELVDTVEPLEEHWTLLVTILCHQTTPLTKLVPVT